MLVQIEGRSYRVLAGHLSIMEVANLLSLSKICVWDAIKRGYIPAETRGVHIEVPADFVERLIFGEVDCVDLPSDSQRTVRGGKCK